MKLDILNEYRESGHSIRDLAQKHDISTGAIDNCKNQEEDFKSLTQSRKRIKTPPFTWYSEVEKRTLKLFELEIHRRFQISSYSIRFQALLNAHKLGIFKFLASNQLLDNLKKKK